MRVSAGTSGFSYKAWKGRFYPETLSAKQMLRYYGERLPAVEINSTFYRFPRGELLEGWAAQVPKGFRFSIKASRSITHFRRLKDVGELTGQLLESTVALSEKLGVILFQLPQNFRVDAERLGAFLQELPEGTRAAFDFRHPSWFSSAIYDQLRERNCALCIAETEAGKDKLVSTADWGYLRLRRSDYADDELAEWVKRVATQDWTEVFVFFKHDDAGTGPRMAGRFLELAGEKCG